MAAIKGLYQEKDWKNEKHMPVIEVINRGDGAVEVGATVGKEIPHPNETKHHIEYIRLFFLPDEEKFPYLIGEHRFCAHGASVEGPDNSTVYAEPRVTTAFKTEKKGKLIAESYCNVHGLWTSDIVIEP